MTEKTDIRDSDEKVVEIEMERLRTFTNHPFKIIGDSQMIELQDSIKKYGVLNPLIVRSRKEGYYEIISGHRRKYAAIKKKAGRKNCGQVDHNTGKRSIDVIGELCGDSAKQVQAGKHMIQKFREMIYCA